MGSLLHQGGPLQSEAPKQAKRLEMVGEEQPRAHVPLEEMRPALQQPDSPHAQEQQAEESGSGNEEEQPARTRGR